MLRLTFEIVALIGAAAPAVITVSDAAANSSGLDLTALGPSASVVACVVLFLRYMQVTQKRRLDQDKIRDNAYLAVLTDLRDALNRLATADDRHTETNREQTGKIDELITTLKQEQRS